MAVPSPLTIPQVLRLVRYELRLPVTEMAGRVGMSVERYRNVEQGLRGLSERGWQTLFLHLPIVEAVVVGSPLPPGAGLTSQAILDEAKRLENLPAEAREIELQRIRLELSWLDEAI